MTWSHVYRYGGYVLGAYFFFSLGATLATSYFQVPVLWHKAGTLEHVERTTIPDLKAAIPRGTSDKTSHATSPEPNCVCVTPPAIPLPKPSP